MSCGHGDCMFQSEEPTFNSSDDLRFLIGNCTDQSVYGLGWEDSSFSLIGDPTGHADDFREFDSFGAQASEFDFYRDQDDTVRGVCMCNDLLSESDRFDKASEYYGTCLPDASAMSAAFEATAFAMHSEKRRPAIHADFERFSVAETADFPPPGVPEDAFFQLELTTVYLPGELRPADIGNAVLEFLTEEANAAAITEVRPAEYTVRAEVVLRHERCTCAIAIYRMSADGYAVEFQRRQGSSLAFQSLYGQAKQYLGERLAGATPRILPDVPAPMVEVGSLSVEPGDGCCLGPALGLSTSEDPELQSQAAAMILGTLESSADLVDLSVPATHSAVQALLQAHCVSAVLRWRLAEAFGSSLAVLAVVHGKNFAGLAERSLQDSHSMLEAPWVA